MANYHKKSEKLKSSNMTHPVFHLQKSLHAVEFTLRAALPHTPAGKQTPREKRERNAEKHLAKVTE